MNIPIADALNDCDRGVAVAVDDCGRDDESLHFCLVLCRCADRRPRRYYVDAVYGPKSTVAKWSSDFIAARNTIFSRRRIARSGNSGTVGDPISIIHGETPPMIADAKVREAVNRDATSLADRSACDLAPHSQSAAPAWLVAMSATRQGAADGWAGTSLFYEVNWSARRLV
jgi:hypothetical protein